MSMYCSPVNDVPDSRSNCAKLNCLYRDDSLYRTDMVLFVTVVVALNLNSCLTSNKNLHKSVLLNRNHMELVFD